VRFAQQQRESDRREHREVRRVADLTEGQSAEREHPDEGHEPRAPGFHAGSKSQTRDEKRNQRNRVDEVTKAGRRAGRDALRGVVEQGHLLRVGFSPGVALADEAEPGCERIADFWQCEQGKRRARSDQRGATEPGRGAPVGPQAFERTESQRDDRKPEKRDGVQPRKGLTREGPAEWWRGLQQPRADRHRREQVASSHREEALLPRSARNDRDESRPLADRHVQQAPAPAEHQRSDDRRVKQTVRDEPHPRDPQLAQRRGHPERRK